MSFDWYPWHIQAWRKNTMHLTVAQDGAYRRLIDEYMMTRGPLLDNEVALARIVGVSVEEWAALATAVRPFFEASNGKLAHSRCEEELIAQLKRHHSHAIAGSLGAEKRWKDHREKKKQNNKLWRPHSVAIAGPMANDSTLQDIRKKEDGENVTARPPATALPTGARAVEPILEQVAKRPSEVSRAELDARIATRRMGKTA
jgi:uncharacterized protein YdaU (DUF1376 family)